MPINQPKIIVVVGPTASGKSELAVKLAKKYNGEIISADSRQIYRGLDIGSGKVTGHWASHPERSEGSAKKVFFERSEAKSRSSRPVSPMASRGGQARTVFVYKNIPHYLIDEANPKTQYSVAKFQKQAGKIIADLLKRGKLPIICGGTGHWIDAVVFEQTLPEVKPDAKLRAKLNKMSTKELFARLQKLDPKRAAEIDAKNPRRLIRALEIVMTTGKPVPKLPTLPSPHEGRVREGLYDAIWLGINPDKVTLHKKIEKRLKVRLKQGLIKEVTQLHNQGLSWKKLESFGLEYKYVALFLQDKLSETEMKEQLLRAIKQYAKRQLTWWKRNSQIHWSDGPKQLLTLAKSFIS